MPPVLQRLSVVALEKPVRCGLLPTELDSDILHFLLLFVNLDYSSLTVPRFLTFLAPASVRTLDRTLDKLFGLPDSQAQWYDPPEFLCSSDQWTGRTFQPLFQ
ncbi:hypothetical protein CRENBAI_012430 [Crenichthys baileyi]|uniref:Uncharacterized protein n=1 Tax=Crenichthys baileyi TaxID=28760 RepID=A0AAV9RCP8_9TELE